MRACSLTARALSRGSESERRDGVPSSKAELLFCVGLPDLCNFSISRRIQHPCPVRGSFDIRLTEPPLPPPSRASVLREHVAAAYIFVASHAPMVVTTTVSTAAAQLQYTLLPVAIARRRVYTTPPSFPVHDLLTRRFGQRATRVSGARKMGVPVPAFEARGGGERDSPPGRQRPAGRAVIGGSAS